jgi:hypothetical protein
MPGHFRLPIGQGPPGTRFPHFRRRRQQRTGISDGPSTYRAAMEDSCVLEKPNIEEAPQAQAGTPKPAMNRPTGARQIVRRPAPAHLHDPDFVPLLHQSKGRNTAAEARTDDDKVEIELDYCAPWSVPHTSQLPATRTGSRHCRDRVAGRLSKLVNLGQAWPRWFAASCARVATSRKRHGLRCPAHRNSEPSAGSSHRSRVTMETDEPPHNGCRAEALRPVP